MAKSAHGKPILSVSNLRISIAQESILRDISFSVYPGEVFVITGPSAAGKSVLMQVMTQAQTPVHWQVSGQVTRPEDNGYTVKIEHLKQRVRQQPDPDEPPNWHGVFANPEAMVFLDEPILGLNKAENRKFYAFCRAQARFGTVVLITHHLPLIKDVGDRVMLICDGKRVSLSDVDTFFNEPMDKMVRDFVRYGNCAFPVPNPLPSHFRWILAGQLAGLGLPGLLDDHEKDLLAIGTAGVTHLVSLTMKPFPKHKLEPFGIIGVHFPIIDMNVPTIKNMVRLCIWVQKRLAQGKVVAFHCKAGLGRTGLVLACQLVWQGMVPQVAIETVRAKNRLYIQTEEQLAFVHQFAKQLADPSSEDVAEPNT